MIQDFTYLKPNSLKEALSMLQEHGDECKIMAGGQSLLIVMREGMVTTDYIIDIKHLKELNYIKFDAKDGLRLGATTLHSDIEFSDVIKKNYPALHEVEDRLANAQVRNWGTIGGNVAHADPAEDPSTFFLAYDAVVTVESAARGKRNIPFGEFLLGFYETSMEHDEIVTELHVPAPEPKTGSAFTKFNLLENDLGVASCTAKITLDASGKCKSAAVVLGCVADKAIRMDKVEKALVGKSYDEKLFEQCCQMVWDEIEPNADIHATAETRKHEAGILAKRMIKKAWDIAKA
jgi:carbon-monoxide dehydrogenase medium subunit